MVVATMEPVTEDTSCTVRVGLGGQSKTVPLRPNEGFEELRGRIAGAFGINAPFDLVGPEGAVLRTEVDAAQALNLGSGNVEAVKCAPKLSVDSNEDTLLELEKAHEESGAMRWQVVRQIFTSMKRQIAELAKAVSDSMLRQAVFDEKLLAEAIAREKADLDIQSNMKSLAADVEIQVTNVSQAAKAAVDEAVVSTKSYVDTMIKSQTAALDARISSLQSELRASEEARLRAMDETYRGLQQLREETQQEAQARIEASKTALAASAAVKSALESQCEGMRREATETRRSVDELGKALLDSSSATKTALEGLRSTDVEIRKAVNDEVAARARALEGATGQLADEAAALEKRLRTVVVELEQQLRVDLGKESLDGHFQGMLAGESASRMEVLARHQAQIEALADGLKVETAERRAGEDRSAAAAASLASEAAKREAKCHVAESSLHHGKAIDALDQRLTGEERGRAAHVAAIRDELGELRALLSLEKDSWTKAHEALHTGHASKHEALSSDLQNWKASHAEESREWAKLLVERLEADARNERAVVLAELRTELEDAWKAGTAALAAKLEREVRRLEASTAELSRSQTEARLQERKQYEAQAKLAANEVQGALNAQVEFAEALEKEQRLLMERLGEGLGREDVRRSDLAERVSAVEADVQKVRGLLPVIFTPASSFG